MKYSRRRLVVAIFVTNGLPYGCGFLAAFVERRLVAVMAEPEQQQEAHKEPEKIPWEEIKKHDNSSSLWIVVHNIIYDVTKFMEEVSHGN